MFRVTMKDGRTFEAELFDRQYDAYKREGWLSLDVDHRQHPEIPVVIGFEECARVVDLAQPDVDLLPEWQGWVTYKTSPVCMEHVDPNTAGLFKLFPTRNTCPVCSAWDGVTFTSVEERFPYGAEPHTVELSAIVERGRCTACAFEFTDARAEIARDAAVRAYLRTKESR